MQRYDHPCPPHCQSEITPLAPFPELVEQRYETWLAQQQTEIKISYAPKLVSFLAGQGVHPRLGVRPLRGYIERFVRRALRENLLGGGKSEIHLTPIEP